MNSTSGVSLAALSLLMAWSGAISAHDGEINITGRIVDKTCSVSADSLNSLVTMGSVSSKQFARAGDGSRYEPFTLTLEKCGDAASNVSVTFSGSADTHNSDLLAIEQTEGSAAGIGIALYDHDKKLIPLNQASAGTALLPHQAQVMLAFYARYLANGDEVSVGTANTSATFVLNYA
ncbi:fimbrial protein [Rahnella bruchi]|uniref:fimbrial protein n=1 Tax=Rahnella bruchi TaxID=1510573 RepID=UPI000EA2ACC9|nr:fimbrial protein [Rahnella bruchi]